MPAKPETGRHRLQALRSPCPSRPRRQAAAAPTSAASRGPAPSGTAPPASPPAPGASPPPPLHEPWGAAVQQLSSSNQVAAGSDPIRSWRALADCGRVGRRGRSRWRTRPPDGRAVGGDRPARDRPQPPSEIVPPRLPTNHPPHLGRSRGRRPLARAGAASVAPSRPPSFTLEILTAWLHARQAHRQLRLGRRARPFRERRRRRGGGSDLGSADLAEASGSRSRALDPGNDQ